MDGRFLQEIEFRNFPVNVSSRKSLDQRHDEAAPSTGATASFVETLHSKKGRMPLPKENGSVRIATRNAPA
jgi:hypothetical protein